MPFSILKGKKMELEQKKRLISLAKQTAMYLGIGIAYFIFVKLTGIYLPCIIKVISGKYCPGCGISHMFVSLAHLDLKGAARCNIFVLSLLPPGIVYFVYKAFKYIKTGENKTSRAEQIAFAIVFVLCVVFWILRNTSRFSYLAPNY